MIGYGRFRIAFRHQLLGHLTEEKLHTFLVVKGRNLRMRLWVLDLTHPVPIRLIDGVTITSVQWSPTPIMDLSKAEFTNETFGVNFQYPASWHKVNDERYEGDDGFFQISALFGADSIDKVCHDEAFQKLMPYGSAPRIIKSQNPYEQSCTILPSADQPADMNGQAACYCKISNSDND